jgi:hypothetical protein
LTLIALVNWTEAKTLHRQELCTAVPAKWERLPKFNGNKFCSLSWTLCAIVQRRVPSKLHIKARGALFCLKTYWLSPASRKKRALLSEYSDRTIWRKSLSLSLFLQPILQCGCWRYKFCCCWGW